MEMVKKKFSLQFFWHFEEQSISLVHPNMSFTLSFFKCTNDRALIRRSNFMRSKFTFSWGWNYFCSWGRICSLIFDSVDQEVNTSIMRSKPKKALLWNFDLMINLLAASVIMRSKVLMHRWLILRAKNLPQVQLTKF